MNIIDLALQLQSTPRPPLFQVGKVVMTRGVKNWAENTLPDVLLRLDNWLRILLLAHVCGHWSEMEHYDALANKRAVDSGEDRVFSYFTVDDSTKIYIITEWDRSFTTILLPEEY